MIKSVFTTFVISIFLFFSTYGEKTCTDIWTIENNINGVALYKVSLHMCTEGIINPSIKLNPIFLNTGINGKFNSSLLNISNLTFKNISNITEIYIYLVNVHVFFV